MAGVALLVFLGGFLRDFVPGVSRLGPDDRGQGASAKGRVHFLEELLIDLVGIPPEEVLFSLDPDLLELHRRRLADIRQSYFPEKQAGTRGKALTPSDPE